MPPVFGVERECDQLATVLVKRPQEAFGDQYLIDTKWEKEFWQEAPEFNRSAQEHFNLCRELKACDVSLRYLPSEWVISLNSVFTRHSAIITPGGGFIKCALTDMGRFDEPTECGEYLEQLGLKPLGDVDTPCLGSDFMWLGPKLLVAATSQHTSGDAVAQVRKLLDDNDMKDVEIVQTDMAVVSKDGSAIRTSLQNAMSMISPSTVVLHPESFDSDFLEELKKRQFRIISISTDEWKAGAAEILMIRPNKALAAGKTTTDSEHWLRIKRLLLEDLAIDLKVLPCPYLSFGEGGFNSLVLPLYRQQKTC